MQKRKKLQQQLLVAGCATMVFASTGCRSAMPKWNMFGSRNTPSAEKLAGNGPTLTYPAPPSESATPEAIASVAGGTGAPSGVGSIAARTPNSDAPVTGFDASASVASLPNSAANTAAANANGYSFASGRSSANAGSTKLPGYASPASVASSSNATVPSIPAGYQFGTRKSAPTPPSGGTSNYAMPSSYPAPGVPSGGSTPSGGYSLPTGADSSLPTPMSGPTMAGFGLPSSAPPPMNSSSGGFELPDSMAQSVNVTAAGGATNAQPFTAKTPSTAEQMGNAPLGSVAPTTGMKLPGELGITRPATTASTGPNSPSFSTASASLTPRSTNQSGQSDNSGYAPGSTSGTGSYPATSGYPSTGTDRSFYR